MEIPSSELFDISSFRRALNRFDTRIKRQTQDIYESLPEVTGMHFTQANHIESIKEKGFTTIEGYPNFVYSFDKKDTEEHYGDRLEVADELGLLHYNYKESIKRFHTAFIEGFLKYGLEGLRDSIIAPRESVKEFLISNKDKLPAVIFSDISEANAIPKEKSPRKLSQAYFNGLKAEKILNIISVDDADIEEISKDVKNGVSVKNSLKKVFVNKTVQWLLIRVEEQRQERIKERDKEYEDDTKKNLIHEWRKSLDEELGSDAIDKIIQDLRNRIDIRLGKECIREINGEEYISPGGLTIAGIFLDQVRAKIELSSTLEKYSDEDKKLAEQLVVHSFGGDELIKMGKCKMSEQVKAEAINKFNRPPENIIYFGSLDDIELALLTGAKEIYMVDYGLDESIVRQMIERVSQYGKNVSYNIAEKVLTFDLDSRSIIARIFQETMQEFNELRGVKSEVIIMYNKGPGMETMEAKKALLPVGICVDNKEDGGF